MNCVNKSSKEFKSLAAKHNVSDNTLELIVHKYWKETGSEELFPSDSYIKAQLGAIPYEEPVKAVKELWQKEYSGVSTYNTFDDLQKAMTEASKYFPAEAIVYYKNADGKYSLLIKKPVVKLNKALDEIQKKGYLEARKESINTENNKEYGVDKAKELFNKFNADRTSLPLADKIFKLADTIGIKVVFSNSLKDGNMGAFGHNTIILNKDFYENSNSNDKKAATILHELIHAITTYAISDKVNAESLSKPLQEFRKDIHQLFTELQYNPALKDERGVLNEREFIAELSNPIFRQKIQAIDSGRKESFWQRVVNAIKKLLGIHSSSPYYTRMMNTLDKAINAFDVKTYMEYNGLNNALKQGTNDDVDYNSFIKNQKELDNIKAKAIKNGTFMKAPNGNPTNLNEKQWLQVRTKAFKDWFGDWEVGLAVNQDNSSFYRGQFDEPYIDANGNLVLYGRKDSLYEKAGYKESKGVSVTRDLKSAIEYGEGQLETRINLVLDSSMDESEQNAVIDNGYYLIQFKDSISNEEIKEAGESKLLGNITIPKGSYVIEHYVQGELIETIGNIDNPNASKVVDENGEPLVVYHGTTTPNITKFDLAKTRSGGAFWFANKEAQKIVFYIGQNSKDIIMMPLFINMRTPLLNNEESMDSDANDETHDGGLILGKLGDLKYGLADDEYQEALDKGLNDSSYLATGNVANPNQLKSAVYNNGDFSKTNDNIDYNTLSTEDIKKEIHDYVDNLPEGAVKSKEALHSFINDLTESDIKNIYNEIEQNRNDVNLVVGKLRQLARDKKSKGNQKYFTFKDGKSVKAPFIPNDQQTEALDKIDDFLKSNKKVMTLSGYAGTGKTSIMEMIAEKAKMDGKKIIFTATTNKATQVLKAKVEHIGFPVMTANKAFGIALEPGDKQEYDADDLKAVLVESKVAGCDAAIIDEASMLNQENFNILTSIAKEVGLKIIFTGDVAQLPPVERDNNSIKLSPVFTNKQGDVITLTKVERTGDNAILKEATNLRDGEELSGVSSFNKDGKGVAYIKPSSQEERDKIIKTFALKMREDPDYFRILTYSNKSVAQYNDTVRRLLGYNDNTPRVGETILGYSNYDYNKQTRQYGFINSGSYKVVSVAPPKINKVFVEGKAISLNVVPVTIKGIDGDTHTYDMVDIKGNDANKKAVTEISKTLSNLWAQWKAAQTKSQRSVILENINYLEKALFVNDDIFNERGYKLLNKRYDFGYAMTIHKSQGSTFKNVLLDDVNIAMYNNYLDREALKKAESKVHHSVDASSVDTTNGGIAAAHSNMDNAEIESSTDFDLFGDDNTQGAASSQTNTTQDNTSDMVDIRRQLEYVGVSRASDTVTIISNNVKKEGSPLHPEEAQTSTASANYQPITSSNKAGNLMNWDSNNGDRKAIIEGANKKFINSQLIDQLKASGITVLGRPYMEKYLSEKGKPDPTYALQAAKENQKELDDIKAKAISDGTFMKAPNGKPTNLNEQQWLQVRTKNFINWFGDWENPKQIEKKVTTGLEVSSSQAWVDGSAVVKRDNSYFYVNDEGTNIEITKDEYDDFNRGKTIILNKETKVVKELDTNFSKVLDENGEPLVMYHRSNDNISIFDISKSRHGGFWFSKDPNYYANTKAKLEYAIPVFLNIRTPNVISHELFGAAVDGDKSIEGGIKNTKFDGWITKDKHTPEFYGDDYDSSIVFAMVLNPNQIKSATDNNGMFSTENDDIRMAIESSSDYGLKQAQKEYDNVVKELVDTEKELQSKTYEDTQSTSDGDIKINQTESDKGSNIIGIFSGRNVFDAVSSSIEADINKNLIGGSLVFPAVNALNEESNFTRLDNPIKANYAGILKTVLSYFIKNGKDRPKSDWQLYIAGDTDYSSKINTLSNILGVDVYPYFQFESREVNAKGLSGPVKEFYERVTVDAKGLLNALPTLQSTKQFSKIEKALEFSNSDKSNYQLKLKALHDKYRALDSKRQEKWNKLQEIKDKIRRKEVEESDLPFFKTPNGEVYGFIDKEGNIYLDENVISPEHPIHEYTHLWDRALQKTNPKLWNRGVELMKQTSLWKTIEEDANYGAKWKKENLSQEELDNRIASEVHARFVGEGGAKLLEKLAKEKGQEGIIAKLKNWILEAWKSLKATFSDWSDDEINKLTLKDFNHMTVRDLTEGINPNKINQQNQQSINNVKTYNGIWTRQAVANDPSTLYIFTDNTDRNSGSGVIPADSWYSKKYGAGHHFPTMTTAVIRGLDNARPISTQRWYHYGAKGITGRWNDEDFDEFKKVIDDEFEEILKEWNTGKYKTIMFPQGDGLFNARISNISETRTPKLYQYLYSKYQNLINTVNGNTSSNNLSAETDSSDNTMPVRDFAEGINPNTINPVQKVLSDKKVDMQKTLSLPNFEHFVYNRAAKDLKGIEIDYPWKESYLKELDSQFRRMEDEDDEAYHMSDADKQYNQKLIDRMKVILNAKDKDSYLDESKRKKEESKQSAMSDFNRLNQQYENLLNGMTKEDGLEFVDSPLTVTEIRDIAVLAMDYISDTITDIQTKEGLAKQLFPNVEPKEGFDFTKADRQDIINTIGIENLINHAKKVFNTEQNDWFDNVDNYEDASCKADFIYNNWDAIVKMGSDIFAFNEGIGIVRDYDNHRFNTTKENLQLDIDNFNDNTDEDSLNETEGDAQEHWQVDFRTIDTINSMSALVRGAIHECYKLDENGEPVVNPTFGIKERVDPRVATNSILRWVQGSLTLEDMIQKLNEKKKDNPWLEQLINKLQDKKNPANIDLQSQFFGVFCKHFQLYSIVIDQDGKFTCINANANPALTEVMNSIMAKYRIGEHPLFQTSGKINKEALKTLHKAEEILPTWNSKVLKKDIDMSPEKIEEYANELSKVSSIFGFDTTPDMVASVLNKDNIDTMLTKLHYIIMSLDGAIENLENKGKEYKPFDFKSGWYIKSDIQNFLKPITDILEDTAINAFYDSGKMYQSYVTPSFTTKFFKKVTESTDENFRKFMEEEYGKSEWFGKKEWSRQYGEIMHWNVPWLKGMVNHRNIFDHRVQLNFNGHNYMRNLTDPEYALSVLSEYHSVDKEDNMDVAWFRIPMESNKPSEEFIKFIAHKGDNYKKAVVSDLTDMMFMEISRIQTVRKRNLSEGEEGFIKNFDTNGRQFCFFPFLNDYIEKGGNGTILKDADGNVSNDNKVLADLLQKKIKGEEELTSEEEIKLKDLLEEVTTAYMQKRADNILEMMDRKGIIQAAQKVKNIIEERYLDTKDENGNELEGTALDEHNALVDKKVREAIENFLWNDYLASKNILMMLVGDTAFYKDAEDLQKRLAELHAPGIRANVNATDYGDPKKGIEPKKVSDGKYRTLILKDFDDFKSNIIANLTEVFDRKIAQAKPYEKAGMTALKEDIIRAYSEINVADAEGYSCMTSYRKKALMFGKWGLDAEEIYKKILNGTYTYTDLKTAFPPMKPFVYTHLLKNMNATKAPISQMYCPFQAKNSEVLLVIADALLKNEKTSRPNLLRAISNIMEDSAYDGRERDLTTGKITKQGTYNGKGIDTVQFESAIKSSLQTPLDLNQFIDDKENGEARAYTWLKSHIYKEGTNDYDTDNYVQEAPFEDYAIQQEIPEHFKNHSQAHGSQIRMIIPSDLDFYYDAEKGREHPEDESNIVKYEWTDDSGKKHSLNAEEFRHYYESTIADNIYNSLDKLAKEFHLQDSNGNPIEDKKERNMALSQILVKEIDSSPRYGIDLRWACSLNDNGEFNIPLGDPIQCKRIEQLINSIIKNRVNKQEIAGGPIVQVSNYGASEQLHIRFNDKNGNLMPSEEEFNKAKEEGTLTDEQKKYSSYQEYAKENQGGIAYYEVFAPIWSDEIAEKFMDKDGNIDMKAIEETNPEMLNLITYRIPTEDKYSMAPCKIVGFMPRQAGETIMFPYELTAIDGSDFDIDKRYVMRKDYTIIENRGKIEKELYKRAEKFIAEKKGTALTYNDKKTLNDKVGIFLDTVGRPDADKLLTGNFDKELKRLYQEIHDDKETMKHCYTTAKVEENSKQFNDNEIVNMSWAVLTNPTSADKMLNPGGFELQKKVGYAIAAYKNPANANVSWQELQAMKTKELKKLSYTQKDLAWFDTQMQFYKQNSAAATLIGIFAVNKIAHAVLEADDFYIDVDEICGSGFNIADTDFKGRMKVDPRYDTNGNLIGKVLGSLVGASADAVKDPVLNLMNINSTTAGMLNTMVRLGLPFEDAALFLSQDIIIKVIDEFNKRNLSSYASINDVVKDFLDNIKEEEHITDESNINSEAISKKELLDGLKEGDHKASDYKVLLAFSKLKDVTDKMRNITFATRFNSISSAVGPLIVDNLIMEHKIGNFLSKENADLSYIAPVNVTKDGEPSSTGFYDKDGNIVDINDVWAAHPILDSFKSTVGMAYKIFNAANMPTNSPKFRTILASLENYGLTEKVFSDKKLLDQLSTFYQSYMLMASELIDSKNLSYYINDFPKKFLKYQNDSKYKDNALIQVIKLNFSRKTKKPFLQIKITGMDAKQKEQLSSAWVDLYKQDPKLSNALFQYSFFRAGIGFSPKTFMALIPVYVKNHLSKTVDGEKITYNDVYKGMYNGRIVNDNVIDQFVRNNWDNNKLVSWANVKKDGLSVNLRTKTLTVYTEDGYNSLMGKMFIKTSAYGNTYLWKKRTNNWSKKETWIYDMVSPLGNNGEYLEINTNEISQSLADTKKVDTKDNQADSDMKNHNAVDDEASSTHNPTTPESMEKQNAASLRDMFIKFNSNLANDHRAENLIEAYKKPGAAEKNVGVLQKIFKANGLDLNEEETIKKFREMC